MYLYKSSKTFSRRATSLSENLEYTLLSMSRTPYFLPSFTRGITTSDLDLTSQEICPGNWHTLSTTKVSHFSKAVPHTSFPISKAILSSPL